LFLALLFYKFRANNANGIDAYLSIYNSLNAVIDSNTIIGKIYKTNLGCDSYFTLGSKRNFEYYRLIVSKSNQLVCFIHLYKA
jgi:hypothetical protein